MAATTCYRPNSTASGLGAPALEASTARLWVQQQLHLWEGDRFFLNASTTLERHDSSTTSVLDHVTACQKLMEGESLLKEPTSVLDLQTSPGRSHLSVSNLSSQHSFNSSSDGISSTLQAVAAEILNDEHDSALLKDPKCNSSTIDQDMATWMDCMGDPSVSMVLPGFQGHACQMKLDGPIADAVHYSGPDMDFSGFGANLMQNVDSHSFHLLADQSPGMRNQEMMSEPIQSALKRLENQLFSDNFPVSQRRHQQSRDGISELLPWMLDGLSALPATAQLQKYTVVPTAELLRLLSSQHQGAQTGDCIPSASQVASPVVERSWGVPNLASGNNYPSPDQRHVQGQASPPRWTSTSAPRTDAPQDENGLHLVHLLLACAEAIDSCDSTIAHPMLTRLKANSAPYGDPMQRIALYFADALSERLAKEMAPNPESTHHAHCNFKVPETADSAPSSLESDLAYQSFYQILPFEKFSHFTANQALLEAVADSRCVHVLDLNIRQGLQWPGFFQSLAMLPNGPPRLRITAVGADATTAQLTGNRLAEFAKSLQVPFEFTIVAEKVEHLRHGMIHLRPDETLAVNCSDVLHSLLRNQGGLQSLLCTIRSLNPRVMSLLEVDANHNLPSLMPRFVEALHYYCALFDSLEATLDRRSSERLRIESRCFGAQIRSIIACEGGDRRVRHVRAETWQSFFRQAGFRELPLSRYAADQAQLLLGLYDTSNHEMPFRLSQDQGAGGLSLGWQETPVMLVSSWTCWQ